MLEILALITLCNKNKSIALARGRKPRLFQVLTVILWFVGEILGAVIGLMLDLGTLGYYALALGCAAVGGFVSYLIAKNCSPGTYQEASLNILPNAQMLPQQQPVNIVREKSVTGMAVALTLLLNGQEAGQIKNGEMLTVYTPYAQNVLTIKDVYGSTSKPLYFSIAPGAPAEIHMKAAKFMPQNCINCTLLSPRDIQMAAEQQTVPPQQ